MIGGDQPHLPGERKIEKEDTTVRAIASLIINVAITANVAPGMLTVYLAELLIHRPQAGTKKRSILATKRHKRHKIFVDFRLTDNYCRVLFSTGRNLMTYIQIPEEHNASAFRALATSGPPVV